jgi:class 3 adenylate cyclase/tetratricopeptide (TPR) repeat protein
VQIRLAKQFCGECGAALGGASEHAAAVPAQYTPKHLAERILTSRSALEGERKLVSVLFCDIVQSTELAARIGEDAMHALLNRFFELALGEVHRYEGTINQFLGDGFMALFGAPLAHEDHVRRALLAALAIRHRLRTRPDPTLSHVQVRMGVNTGTVVVGKIGDNLRMDYTAVGDTTHLAARLEHAALPDTICVSPSTERAAVAWFEFKSLGQRALKGIAEPLEVFELVRARVASETRMATQAGRIGSPLVGRQQERSLLKDSLNSLRQGHGGIVLLTGEPGVGKSRLLAEARRSTEAAGLRWLEGRSLSFGRNLSYWPFIEILKQAFGIEESDSDARAWTKLEQGCAGLFAERADDIVPYLGTVLALEMIPAHESRVKYLDSLALGRQVYLSMRQLFERLASRQPLLVLMEDWHWVDQSSVALCRHLLPLAGSSALSFWFAARPEPKEPMADVRKAASQSEKPLPTHEIALVPLAQEHCSLLLHNLVGENLPAAFRGEVLRKTEGNPFFIEEIVRVLIAEGALTQDLHTKAWRLTKPVDALSLPDTVQGVIVARIDRLEEEVKDVLKLASVIGRSFFLRVLKAISTTTDVLETSLGKLEQAELIRLRQQLPELEYIFKHALVQEAAYGSIVAERRKAIHGAVANAIETLFQGRLEEFTSMLAYHYARAEDWDKAQAYLFKAGDQAGRMAADGEALEHFRHAEAAYLKAFGDRLSSLQRASLDRKVGAALYGTGQYERAHEQFRRALSQVGLRYPASRWGVRRAIMKYLVAHFLRRLRGCAGIPTKRDMDREIAKEISAICHHMSWMDYFFDQERMFLDSLLELHVGERSHYPLAEARGLSSLGFGFAEFNVRRLARMYHIKAGAVAQETNNPSAVAFAWLALGFLDFYDGRWDDGEVVLGKAAAAYREAGDIHGWGGATLILSFVTYFRGRLTLAEHLSAELVRAGQDAADPQVASWGLQNSAYPGLACGPLDDVAAKLRNGASLAAKIPAWQNLVYQYALLAKCSALRGRLDECRDALSEARRVLERQRMNSPFDQVEYLTAVAAFNVALADRMQGAPRGIIVQEARRAAHKAVHLAHRVAGWVPEALRLQGTSAWLSGDREGARRCWHKSLTVAERSEFPLEHARTLMELGHRTGDIHLVEQASRVFEQAGAKVFLALALHSLALLGSGSAADTSSAIACYANAMAALDEVKAEYELGVAARDCANLYMQLGEPALAATHRRKAQRCFEAVGATFEQVEMTREVETIDAT